MNQRVQDNHHQELSVFGIGKDLTVDRWNSVVRQLLARSYLTVDNQGYSTLVLTAAAKSILKGDEVLMLRQESERSASRSKNIMFNRKKSLVDLPAAAQERYERLKAWRLALAKEHSIPAYFIFNDTTLQQIAVEQPDSLRALANISGVGQHKLDTYGSDILNFLRES